MVATVNQQTNRKEKPRPKTLKANPTQFVLEFRGGLGAAHKVALDIRDGLRKSLQGGETINFNSLKDMEKSLRFWENAEGYARKLLDARKAGKA